MVCYIFAGRLSCSLKMSVKNHARKLRKKIRKAFRTEAQMSRQIPYLFLQNTAEDYLKAALQTAEWIRQYEVKESVGKTWKIFPDGQNGLSDIPVLGKTSFYAGSSGIGFFFLRLYQVTGDEKWLNEAREAAAYLLANEKAVDFYKGIQQKIASDPSRLYGWAFGYKVGPISEGQFVYDLFLETREKAYEEFAIRQADVFVSAVIEDGIGVHWSDARDIVGDAGGAVYLLQTYKATGDKKYLDTALKYASYLEKFGHAAKNGGTYYDLYDLSVAGEGEKGTVHVNFSHGSAGIGYFFAVLYEATRNEKFLRLAKDIVAYLDGISAGDDDAVLFPYQDHPVKGPDKDRFYLGMCGGPIGSSLFFKKLYDVTKDETYLGWVKRLANGLVKAGVPEKKSWGYWGSKCICCGGPGALEYFAAFYGYTGDDWFRKFALRTADILIAESNTEFTGRTWFGAWDRIAPARVVSYLGFYIGAAGAAGSLLRLYGALRGKKVSDFFEYIL